MPSAQIRLQQNGVIEQYNCWFLQAAEWLDLDNHALTTEPLTVGDNILDRGFPLNIPANTTYEFWEPEYISPNSGYTIYYSTSDSSHTTDVQQITMAYVKKKDISQLGIAVKMPQAGGSISNARFVYQGQDSNIYVSPVFVTTIINDLEYPDRARIIESYTPQTESDKPMETNTTQSGVVKPFQFWDLGEFASKSVLGASNTRDRSEITQANLEANAFKWWSLGRTTGWAEPDTVSEAMEWAKDNFIKQGSWSKDKYYYSSAQYDISLYADYPFSLPLTMENNSQVKAYGYPSHYYELTDSNGTQLATNDYFLSTTTSSGHTYDSVYGIGIALEPYSSTITAASKLIIFGLIMASESLTDGGADRVLVWGKFGEITGSAIQTFLEDVNLYQNETVEDVTSEPEGGEGEIGKEGKRLDESDGVSFPSLPTTSALSSGFIKIYNPGIGDVRNLATQMTNTSCLDELKKFFTTNPLDVIISLHTVPIQVTQGTAENVMFGTYDTGISMAPVTSQTYIVNLGTCEIKKWTDTQLDFSPSTKAQIYLPFVGYRQLNIDDIMGKTLTLKYYVDILTGDCTAMLSDGTDVKYAWSGNCMMSFPLTNINHNSLVAASINGALSTAGGIVSAATGNVAGGVLSMVGAAASVAGAAKPDIQHGGGIAGNAGYLSNMKAHILLDRPIQNIPDNFGHHIGYTTNNTYTVGSLDGWVVFSEADVNSLTATNPEKEQIESLLKEGVYIR